MEKTEYELYTSQRKQHNQQLKELSELLSSKRQRKLKNAGKKSRTQRQWEILNEREKFVSLIESGKEEEFFEIMKKTYQGGLSDEIFDSEIIKNYAKNMIGDLYGYFGLQEGFRTKEIDEYIEKEIKKTGMTTEQIVKYLCSPDIRRTIEIYVFELNGDINNEEDKKKFIDEAIKTIPRHYYKPQDNS